MGGRINNGVQVKGKLASRIVLTDVPMYKLPEETYGEILSLLWERVKGNVGADTQTFTDMF
jgi:hypothetical protein